MIHQDYYSNTRHLNMYTVYFIQIYYTDYCQHYIWCLDKIFFTKFYVTVWLGKINKLYVFTKLFKKLWYVMTLNKKNNVNFLVRNTCYIMRLCFILFELTFYYTLNENYLRIKILAIFSLRSNNSNAKYWFSKIVLGFVILIVIVLRFNIRDQILVLSNRTAHEFYIRIF